MPAMPPPSVTSGPATSGPSSASTTYGTAEYWDAQRKQGKPTPPWYKPPSAQYPNGYILGTPEYYKDAKNYKNANGAAGTGPGGAAGVATLQAQTGLDTPYALNDDVRKRLLAQQAAEAGKFAGASQLRYEGYGQQAQGALDGLAAQARGQNSVSAEQLRQGLQMQMAQQRSMAQGGAPQDSAARTRTAAIQMGRSSAGLAGQQAMAGLQERNQAQAQYGQLLQGLRGQDLNASNAARQTAANAYGANSAGAPTPSWWDKNGDQVIGAGVGAAAALSDRRAKTDVQDGDAAARRVTRGLRSYMFRYRDPADSSNGDRPELGVMADELERAGLKQAVVDTPRGKVVHGAKLATANTAMIAEMGRRLDAIEARGGPTTTGESEPMSPALVRRRQLLAKQLQIEAQRAGERMREVELARLGRARGAGPGSYAGAAGYDAIAASPGGEMGGQ